MPSEGKCGTTAVEREASAYDLECAAHGMGIEAVILGAGTGLPQYRRKMRLPRNNYLGAM